MVTVYSGRFITMQPPDSVLLLANSYLNALEHEQQVAKMALMLFECLQPLHQLNEEERLLLQCSALLHDIGWAEGSGGHHKAAQQLILAAPLLPFDLREQTIIALVARYHRKALPSTKHQAFAELSKTDQRIVCVLSGILRVADGLDRSHASVVRELSCETQKDEIYIRCVASGRAQAECEMAMEKSDLLRKTFHRDVIIRMR